MTAILHVDLNEDGIKDISEIPLEKITLDDWFGSGYRSLIPEKECLSSDDY